MNNGSFDPNAYGSQGGKDQNNGSAPNPQNANPQSEQTQQQASQSNYGGQGFNGQPYNGQPYNGQPYNGQPYNGQSYGQPYTPYQPPVQPAHGLALASLICAIVGFVCCGLFASIPAVICAVMARKQGNTEAIATVGLIMGIVGIVLSALSAIASLAILPMYMEMMEEMMREAMGGMLFFLK